MINLVLVLSLALVPVLLKCESNLSGIPESRDKESNIFVLFHDPFCLASQRAELEFKKIKQMPLSELSLCPDIEWTSSVKFIQHDIVESVGINSKSNEEEHYLLKQFQVDTFPAVRLYVSGQLYIYKGEWTAKAMITWLFKKLEISFCVLPSKSTLEKFLTRSFDYNIALILQDQLATILLENLKALTQRDPQFDTETKRTYDLQLLKAATSFIKAADLTDNFEFGVTSKDLLLDVAKEKNLTTEHIGSHAVVIKRYMKNFIFPWTGDLTLDTSTVDLVNFLDELDNLRIFNFSSVKRFNVLLQNSLCIVYVDNPKYTQNFKAAFDIFSSIVENESANNDVVFLLAETFSDASVRFMRYLALDFLTDIPKIIAVENSNFSQRVYIPEDPDFAKQLSAEKLISFINNIKEGKMPVHLKSERTCSAHESKLYDKIKKQTNGFLRDLTRKSLLEITENGTGVTVVLFYSFIKPTSQSSYSIFQEASRLEPTIKLSRGFRSISVEWGAFNVEKNDFLETNEPVPQVRVFFPKRKNGKAYTKVEIPNTPEELLNNVKNAAKAF